MKDLDPPIPRARDFSAQAAELYIDAGPLQRFLATKRPYIAPFERVLPHVPVGASVLDVGCGIGLFGAMLAANARHPQYTGFDSNAPAVAVAQGMAKRSAVKYPLAKLEFHRLDVEAPWPAGIFDVVSIIDVMHHVPPPAAKSIVELAVEKLRPGGTLIYKDMARRPRWRALANRLHDLTLARQWIHYLPVEQVESWAQDLGCTRTLGEDMSRWWYAHELRVFRKA
jgi:2-polyprenyl-3-methyl-5-hydroxy-6-metoxy-1,4-benzoquinol methylase